MPRYLNHLDMTGNQIQNAVIQPLASDPGSPKVGQIWFHNTAGGDSQGRLRVKLGTRTLTLDDQYVTGVGVAGVLLNGGSSLAPNLSVQAADSTHDGYMSQTFWNLINNATNAATINTLVRRDSSGNAIFNQLTLNNAPVNGTDAVNKNYADSLAAGFDPKGSCVLATVGALPAVVYANGTAGVGATLTASANAALTQTMVDGGSGYTIVGGERILVKNQAANLQNGIYVVTQVGTGALPFILTRATDFNTTTIAGTGMISSGAFMFIESGINAATQWIMTSTGTITMGTTGMSFTQFGAGATYTNGNGLSLGGNTFSINLTGTTGLEFNSGALRLKSSATANQVLLSAGTGNEPAYGALPLGNASAVSGTLGKANGGFGQDVSSGIAANLFAASPNGASGAMSFRAMVKEDFPTTGLVGAGTYTKVTFDAYGRPTGSAALATGDIPNLDFAKITSGIVPTTQGGTGLNLASVRDIPSAAHLPVRVVATSNLSTSAPGANIDGVAMVAGDRVLLTAQSTGNQNGIWIWNAAGSAMTRPTDYPAAGTSHAYYGVYVEVLAGTVNTGTTWFLSTTAAITIDTTSTAWTQLSYNLASGITGQVPVANGGTGSGTAAGARTNLGAAGVGGGTVTGDNVTLNFVITHGLNSDKVVAHVTDPAANNAEVFPDIEYTSNTTCTVKFAVAPGNGILFNVRCEG